jgi:hypothetical protein
MSISALIISLKNMNMAVVTVQKKPKRVSEATVYCMDERDSVCVPISFFSLPSTPDWL